MDRVILPPADWREREGLAGLCAVLGPDAARYVGGAVRDTLLGIPVSDVDLATPLVPTTVMERLRDAGIRAVPTGITHGTVTAILPSGPVEVTTLRAEIETDGRRAVVAFTADWAEDAARRDFTMNALYADPESGAVFDYFGGLADLAARRVRFIGDPRARIAEDHLRILRFFRFHARFGDAIDPAGLDACADLANTMMALSRERIAAELLRLLVAPAAVPVVGLMVDRGIFRPIIPEIGSDGVPRLSRLTVAEATAGLAPDPVRRLAALLPTDAAEAVAVRLKLSNVVRKRIGAAVKPLGNEDVVALAYLFGVETAIDRLLLAGRAADAAALVGNVPPRFPLSGGDIVARGIARGPDVARLLKAVEDQWIAEGFPDAGRVARIADAIVAQAAGAVSQE